MPAKRPRGAPQSGSQPESTTDPAGQPVPAEGAADRGEGATFNILFVCTGNTCRSPLAEVIAREEVARRGWTHVRTASAGVAAGDGAPASEPAVVVARRHGLELEGHRSRRLTPAMVEWADLILAMGPSHLASISHSGGRDKGSVLTDFVAQGGGRRGPGISDPFGGSVAVYERTYRELKGLISSALDRLAPILHP